MKNLSGYILLSTLAGLVLLTVASCLGISFPFLPLASQLVGLSCAAGVVAIFLGDYASPAEAPAGRVTETARETRPVVPAKFYRRQANASMAASLRLRRDPATVSQ